MGMSSHVEGIRPPDAKWLAMKAVYDSCRAAGVRPPQEVDDFFNYEQPDPKGVIVSLKDCCSDYNQDSSSGFEVDLSKLPKGITVIRFYNSW